MSRRLIVISVVVIALVSLSSGVVSGATPIDLPRATADTPAVGSQFHAMWDDYTKAKRIEVLDKLARAGVEWVRIDLGWSSFQEKNRRSYSDWYVKRADFVINAARERGLQVLGTLWQTPRWANGGRAATVPPDRARDFGRFAKWIADRYEGRVAAWEIWNEPNDDFFFDGSVGRYVRLLKAAYPRIKEAAPTADVVLGGPSYNDTGWLKKVYEKGAKPYFDVMATHPYQAIANLPPETPDDGTIWRLSHVGAVIDLMERRGDGDKPIWFTEFGWSSHANHDGLPDWQLGVTKDQQADYLVRTLVYLEKNFPQVKKVFWYNERNRNTGHLYLDNYGLLSRRLRPKPVYDRLKNFLTG